MVLFSVLGLFWLPCAALMYQITKDSVEVWRQILLIVFAPVICCYLIFRAIVEIKKW